MARRRSSLTSGNNRNLGLNGARIAAESNEYVFVFDRPPLRRSSDRSSRCRTFGGIAWHPSGQAFYVTCGVNDVLREFRRPAPDQAFAEVPPPIALGHQEGLGLGVPPMGSGLAISPSGADRQSRVTTRSRPWISRPGSVRQQRARST